MNRLFQSLRPFIRGVVTYAWLVILLAIGVSAVAGYTARNVRIDTDFSQLVPSDYPSVQALERLRDTVGGESDVAVGIVSPSFDANRAFAEDLIPRALELQRQGLTEPYLTRVEYKRNTEFLKDNALYFATPAELDTLEMYLQDQIEEARLEANPFFFDLEDVDEEEEPAEDATAASLAETYEEIVGREYPVSDDSTTLVLRFYPSGSQTDIGFIENLYADLDALIEDMDPQSYHPAMEVTLAGRLLRQATEVRAITRDVVSSFGTGVSLVLLLVLTYFAFKMYHARQGRTFSGRVLAGTLARLPVLALLISLPLLMSLTWTFAAAYLAFGALNLMTSTLGLVLFGLGIDYGIHFFARYSEERGRGGSVEDAIVETFTSTGQAITVGALTTALALYVLVIADFKGFSEFGFMAGTGILFALVGMLIVLPALLTVLERLHLIKLESASVPHQGVNGHGRRFPAAKTFVGVSVALVLVAVLMLPKVGFEYRFGELEPEYEEYEERRDVIRQVHSNSSRRNPAYVLVDDPAEVPAVVEAVKRHAATDTLTPTISHVESLQERFPMTEENRERRLERIAEIRELLSDPFLSSEASDQLDQLRRAAQTTEPIDIEDVPESLRKRYTSKTGEIGNFVMIYPSVGLSDGRQSIAFSDDVGTIVTEEGKVYHAGSTSLVAADMLRLMLAEAPWMILATLLIVATLMWLNFGSARWALVALIPLLVGVLWMLLLTRVFGVSLNFYNLVVLPAVLGIGNDAGVHLVHRYREEGFGSLRAVLRSTGEHVTMGSVTTMVGFGGLLLSFHPGLASIGQLAVLGIGATLVAALAFLPAMLQLLEDRDAMGDRLPGRRMRRIQKAPEQEEYQH